MANVLLIQALPKVELHLHLEGSLEPELMFALAQRNGVSLPFESVAAVRAAYEFSDLQSFLDIYYQGANVLQTEQDFYDLTRAYLSRMAAENVRHVEPFFDPQTHTDRGVAFDVVADGILRALADAKTQWGISSRLIMCFLRHLSPESAMAALLQALAYNANHGNPIVAVGLDSSERDRPPVLFEAVFAKAKAAGLKTVAHAGEEGPADYIWQALTLLSVARVDHGVRCVEDPALVSYLAQHRVPLTVCPLSNIKLRVFDTMAQHNLGQLLDAGLCVTVNSDDPAYFGGYMVDNYVATQDGLQLSDAQVVTLARNSVEASFLPHDEQATLIGQIEAVAKAHGLGV
jgi:adenosine deaminase